MSRTTAIDDFQQARRRATLERLLARITGKSPELLAYEDVRRSLKASNLVERGLHEIPLDAIVGSVGRYRDFSRSFLPLSDEDESRWTNVKVAQVTKGVPPIEVYKIDEAYFVQDGNHRVSVARQMGMTTIEAYVKEVQTNVPLSPDVQPDDLILKAEYAEFLAQTRLDKLRPDADLSLTAPGKYPLLLEHIQVHQYYLGLEQQQDIPYEEATTSWYDAVYQPTVRLIATSGLLHDFPQRSAADLYLWLTEHRARIEESLGMKVKPARAAADLKTQAPESVAFGLGRVLKTDDVPPQTKQEVDSLASSAGERLFETILVPFSRMEQSWTALDQAFTVAQREGGRIRGLLFLEDAAEGDSLLVREFQTGFQRRCQAAGVPGELTLETRSQPEALFDLARWVDLMILAAPQGELREAGLKRLVKSLPGPILLLPSVATALQNALLVYDGSRASEASLAAAGYLARYWGVNLTVNVSAPKSKDAETMHEQVTAYLRDNAVSAPVHSVSGKLTRSTWDSIVENDIDLVLWGDSGKSALNFLARPQAEMPASDADLALLLSI